MGSDRPESLQRFILDISLIKNFSLYPLNESFFSKSILIPSATMQGILTSREAWTRFACALFVETELTPQEIGKESDMLLIQYLKRFPDPPERESAVLVESGNTMEFTGEELFETEAEPPLTERSPDTTSDEDQS